MENTTPTRGTEPAPHSLEGLPLLLTVTEAAQVLRISRTSAYKLVDEHRATGGRSGLPCVQLGSRLLVRRVDLAVIVGVEPAS
jgi:excisionase family DNA binding protein